MFASGTQYLIAARRQSGRAFELRRQYYELISTKSRYFHSTSSLSSFQSASSGIFESNLIGMPPKVTSLPGDLPSETLYIFDGTAMLFQAYYSREHSFQYTETRLAEPLASRLRSEHPIDMNAYKLELEVLRAFPSEKGSYINTSLQSAGPLEKNHSSEDVYTPLHCGALVVLALNFARFIQRVNPKYIAVAFDAGRKTFRNDLYVLICIINRPCLSFAALYNSNMSLIYFHCLITNCLDLDPTKIRVKHLLCLCSHCSA